MHKPTVSVVIPAFQELATLPRCLAPLLRQEPSCEVVVVDGGTKDGTVGAARSFSGVRAVLAPRGRARQLNVGAGLAQSDYLWFLHADSQPGAGSVPVIRHALEDPAVSEGAFRFQLDGSRLSYRVIEAGVSVRSRWLHLPSGDQGLFLRRSDFVAIGGYRDVPLFGDVYLLRELRPRGRLGAPPERLAGLRRDTVRDPSRHEARR